MFGNVSDCATHRICGLIIHRAIMQKKIYSFEPWFGPCHKHDPLKERGKLTINCLAARYLHYKQPPELEDPLVK